MKDLAGFFFTMMNHPTKQGIVYYTSKISHNIINNSIRKNIKYIKKGIKSNEIKLYDYQKRVIDDYMIPYFKKNKHGILNMACGTRKTIASGIIINMLLLFRH